MRWRNWVVSCRRVGVGEPTGNPRTSIAHARGSASADNGTEVVPARWVINAGPTGPRQRIAWCSSGAITRRLGGASRSTA